MAIFNHFKLLVVMATALLLFMFTAHIMSAPKKETSAVLRTDRVELKPPSNKRPARPLKTAFRNRTAKSSESNI